MTKQKNVLIIEDEITNAQRLQRLLLEIRPGYKVIQVLSSVTKSVDWFSGNESPDLVLMDIHLADGISFEIFNLIEVKSPIIFTTAYDEYAVDAFKVNSIDYLLKPIERDELESAIVKFEGSKHQLQDQIGLIKDLLEYHQKREYRTRFLLPFKDGYKTLQVSNIAYFHSEQGVTISVNFDGEKNIVPLTLESLEQQLDSKRFFRVNRQYIVHISAIDKVHNYFNSKLKLDIKQCMMQKKS